MRKIIALLTGIIGLTITLTACKSDIPVPKPSLYLKHTFPKQEYQAIEPTCPYTFEVNKAYTIKDVNSPVANTCHKEMDLGMLNGAMHFSYMRMTEPLSEYVNYINDKVEEHIVKASGKKIRDYVNPETKVYGTIFEIQGNVATPIQFYLTDSTNHFFSGVLYFNAIPKYDSLKTSIEYVNADLEHMINTFKWK